MTDEAEIGQPLAPRRASRRIWLGKVAVGGGAPISVQSMATADTRDRERCEDQLRQLQAAGADILRVAVPDMDAARNLGALQRAITLPLVADIHFDWRLALTAISQGVQGIRLNPGNIGGAAKVREVAKAAKDRGVPIRVGVNAGSLEKRLLAKHGGRATPEAMVESAKDEIRLLEDEDFTDIKVSLKASDVSTAVRAYRLAARAFDYPLHLGITEAGTLQGGSVKSAAGLGILLAEGIGDTIRVSLAADPIEEVRVGLSLLRALGLRRGGLTFVACPTCGRCEADMIPVAERVEKRLSSLRGEVHVAVMGCEVNGPGEGKAADVGIAYGHNGVGLLFKKGEIVARLPAAELEARLVEEAEKLAK